MSYQIPEERFDGENACPVCAGWGYSVREIDGQWRNVLCSACAGTGEQNHGD